MAEQKPIPESEAVSAQLRGETMAYAAQHGVLSIAANLYEPYINLLVQKQFSKRDASHQTKHGSYVQNFFGELAGDVSGFGSLMLAEMLVPKQLHATTRAMRKWVDPLYCSVAHHVFADERGNPDYDQKVRDWATFQERNLVRSSIMLTTGVAGNLAAQKFLLRPPNPAPTKIIFLGKLASSSLTTGLGLGARFALPQQMKHMDGWMGKNLFAPMMRDTSLKHDGHAARIHSQQSAEFAPAR